VRQVAARSSYKAHGLEPRFQRVSAQGWRVKNPVASISNVSNRAGPSRVGDAGGSLVYSCLALVSVLWLASTGTVYGWGPAGHRLVTSWAIERLPPEIRAFFEANRQFLIDSAGDPDERIKKDRNEVRHHRIYLDKYGLFPFLTLPHSYAQAVAKYGSNRISRDGLLPWQIGKFSLRLTDAMKARDWESVKLNAGALGHYVADARDPLNTTQNFDGQLTGQEGLEARFGARLIERYANFFISRQDPAAKIDDPTEYAFDMCLEAHSRAEQVVLADRKSREGLRDYSDDYFDRFYTQIGSTAMQQINQAAHDVGSYWYTAWLNADRPELPPR